MKKPNHVFVRPRWTEKEMKILEELYATTANSILAKKLKRSITSIVYKAFRMNLSKNADRLKNMGLENIRKRWGSKRKKAKK